MSETGGLDRLAQRATRHLTGPQGRTLVWRRFGAGPPLLLIHGGHGDWRHWMRNVDALAARHTVWVSDLPGFGESDELDGSAHAPDRMQRLVDALHAGLVELLGASAAPGLVGFSFGALVSAHLAARHPVSRLALLGPGGHGGRRRQTRGLLDWRAEPAGAQRFAAFRENLGRFMLHDAAAVDDIAVAVYRSQCERTRFRSRSISLAGGLPALLDRLKTPILLAWGEHDVTADPEPIAALLTAGHPNRASRVVRGAGHWVQYERADEVNATLLDWFAPPAAPC